MLKKAGFRIAGAVLGSGMLLAAMALPADAAPRRYHRGDAGAAFAVGALALGVGAAIAASQRDRYYGPGYAYDPAYLGYPPGYGYAPGYAVPVYPQWGYAQRPRYYGPTGYGGGNYWQRRERNRQQYLQN